MGTGLRVPERVVDNNEIGGMLGIEPGWIEPRTGIRQRRYAGEDEAVSDLAVGAGGEALHKAGVDPLEVDLLVLATSTPDHLLPPTAPLVASRLGIHNAGAFDLAGACTGFLNAFTMASASIESGRARRALIVGANILSRRVNSADRSTAILFGDGAGALLLGLMEGERGLLAAHHGTDGAYYEDIRIPAGGSRMPYEPDYGRELYTMRMERGGLVYREAVRRMAESLHVTLKSSGLGIQDLDWLVPHQANKRIMDGLADRLKFPRERVISNVAYYGNTSAASIPMAMHEAVSEGRFRAGDKIGLAAFGAGFTYASAILVW